MRGQAGGGREGALVTIDEKGLVRRLRRRREPLDSRGAGSCGWWVANRRRSYTFDGDGSGDAAGRRRASVLNVGRAQGVYNTAVAVLTEASGFNTALIEELRELQNCEDWAMTAAVHLLLGSRKQEKEGRRPSRPLAAPLPCNQSQEEILEHLRRAPLTIVTGPPGTGKTQLVVNAVTNAWLDGEKVLVTSTNNAAVDVAVARAETDVFSGLLMRTGNRTVREQVPDRITAASEQAATHTGDPAEARAWLKRSAVERSQLMEKLALLDKLDTELLRIAEKLDETRRDLREAAKELWTDASPSRLSMDSPAIERRASRLLRAWFFRRFRARRLRKRLGCIESASLEQIVTWACLDRYRSKLISELEARQAEHQRLKAAVGNPATSVREVERNWAEASRCAIRADAAARIRSRADRLAPFARAAVGGGSFKRTIANSLDGLRGWACTALSASPNFPLESGLFDLVIVDEASQCSLAAVLPLAYRAKRLAVVGDPCQLQPIVPLGDRLLQDIAVRTGLVSDDLRRRGIHHKDGSAYLAFEIAVRPHAPSLLNEHYRCHPHIARWFNRTFYRDELTVLTEVAETTRRDRTILWQDVDGAAERSATGSSWLNRAFAESRRRSCHCRRHPGTTSSTCCPGLLRPRGPSVR